MVDYTQDRRFGALLSATERITAVLAANDVADAQRIADRSVGWHNLQGHARAVVPLALWLARQRPEILCDVRGMTDLNMEMTNVSQESRGDFWDGVKTALIDLLQLNGDDRIISGQQANSPETAREIASTYISSDYGGGQTTGGAGPLCSSAH